MISDDILLYLLFNIIILLVNMVGYTKIPLLLVLGLIGTIAITVPTIDAFGDYYLFAVFILLINASIPIAGLGRTFKGDSI